MAKNLKWVRLIIIFIALTALYSVLFYIEFPTNFSPRSLKLCNVRRFGRYVYFSVS